MARLFRPVPRIHSEYIKYYSDYQLNWNRLIEPLKRGHYTYTSASFLTIHGDAPKNFIRQYEYKPGEWRRTHPERWPGFIAKVGSKWYPIESITEHLITRIGQELGLNIADSQLRVVGRQVRFLSRYFLDSKTESLVHGAELFIRLLDKECVEEIARQKAECEFFTVQTIFEAIQRAFPDYWNSIIPVFLEMVAFDAIIGHHDRHAFNWGVIVPVNKRNPPVFSPIFDTARALFWNNDERKVSSMLRDKGILLSYINRSRPQIGWDGSEKINHFDLVEMILHTYPQYKPSFDRLVVPNILNRIGKMVEAEFSHLLSKNRIELIGRCLEERYARYCTIVERR